MADTPQSPLVFPCEFAIKVFGVATDRFLPQVMELVRRHLPEVEDAAFRSRASQDGKYLAVTINLYVESKEQLDAIYRELTGSQYVLMAL